MELASPGCSGGPMRRGGRRKRAGRSDPLNPPHPRIAETSYPDHTPVIPVSYHRYLGPNRRRMALSIVEQARNRLIFLTARRLHPLLTAPPDNTSRPDDTKRRHKVPHPNGHPRTQRIGAASLAAPPGSGRGYKAVPKARRLPKRHGASFVSLRWITDPPVHDERIVARTRRSTPAKA